MSHGNWSQWHTDEGWTSSAPGETGLEHAQELYSTLCADGWRGTCLCSIMVVCDDANVNLATIYHQFFSASGSFSTNFRRIVTNFDNFLAERFPASVKPQYLYFWRPEAQECIVPTKIRLAAEFDDLFVWSCRDNNTATKWNWLLVWKVPWEHLEFIPSTGRRRLILDMGANFGILFHKYCQILDPFSSSPVLQVLQGPRVLYHFLISKVDE